MLHLEVGQKKIQKSFSVHEFPVGETLVYVAVLVPLFFSKHENLGSFCCVGVN